MFDWSGFYVGLGIFIVLAVIAAGYAQPIAARLELVEWHGNGKNRPMY